MSDISVTVKHAFIRGIHSRPSLAIVKAAMKYEANIILSYNGVDANAKSMIAVMLLTAPSGVEIGISAEGDDAEGAVAELEKVLLHGD